MPAKVLYDPSKHLAIKKYFYDSVYINLQQQNTALEHTISITASLENTKNKSFFYLPQSILKIK